MNKIHSCTQVKPAAACSFLSLPCASWFLGCLWDGVAQPGWGLTPEPSADSWCRESHWLTHLHLLPEIAAQQPALLWCHRRPAQAGSPLPTPGGFGAQKAPGNAASGTLAPPTPAHTRSQPRQLVGWPTCHPPCHPRVTVLLAPGTWGHGPGVCGTLGLSPQV